MDIVMTKEEILRQLKARLPFARKFDAEQLTEHRAAEKAALKDFRDRLRVALKAPYKEVKGYGRYAGSLALNPPECPVSFTARVKRCIRQVEMDTRQKITLSQKLHTAEIHYCLTFDPYEVRSVCAMSDTPITKPELIKLLRDLAAMDLASGASIHDHPATIAANVLEDVHIPFRGEDDVLGHLREEVLK